MQAIWFKLIGGVTSPQSDCLRCDPSSVTIAEFKKLVRAECSPLLDFCSSIELIIKTAEGGDDFICGSDWTLNACTVTVTNSDGMNRTVVVGSSAQHPFFVVVPATPAVAAAPIEMAPYLLSALNSRELQHRGDSEARPILSAESSNPVITELMDTTSVDQFLAKYSLNPMTWYDEFVPYTGSGRLILRRERVVLRIMDRISRFSNSKPSSLYFRGVKGSGKTFLLHLIGQKLVAEGRTVLWVNGTQLNFWSKEIVAKLLLQLNTRMKEASGTGAMMPRLAYVLIDETPSGTTADNFTMFTLLRDTPYIVTIATGVPKLESRSASFEVKLGGSELLFQEEDMQECIDAFAAEFPAVSREVVAATLSWSRDYTNGHPYPFLRLAEYCLRERLPECELTDFVSITSDAALWSSEAMRLIRSRSFDNESALKDAWRAVIAGNCSNTLMEFLVNSGYILDPGQNSPQFLSTLFMTLCLQSDNSPKDELPLASLAPKQAVQSLLLAALERVNEGHFLGSDSRPLLENSMTYHLLSQLHRFDSVHVTFQVPLRTGRSGHPPTVDGFLNGRIQHFVEIVRNGVDLKGHFARFEDDDGAYRQFRDNYVIINIETKRLRVPHDVEPYNNPHSPLLPKLYTFCVMSNRLYLGQDCIKESVSTFLPTPPPDEAFNLVAKRRKG